MTARVLKGLAYALLAVSFALMIFVQIFLTPFHGQLEMMGILEGNENTSKVAFTLLSLALLFLLINIYLGWTNKIDMTRSLMIIHLVLLVSGIGIFLSWVFA